jgi:hypothetical protein
MTAQYRRRPGDQPLPEPAGGPSMHDLVCEDIRTRWASGTIGAAPVAPAIRAVTAALQERKQLGLRRYGQLLQAGNGRDALRDLAEELQDAVVYCRQAIEEGKLPAEHAGVMYDGLIAMLFRVAEAREAMRPGGDAA